MGFYKSVIMFALCFATAVYSCPSREELGRHCSCNGLRMICSKMNNQEQFISAIEAIAKHRTKLSSLSIMFSSELNVPNNIFNNTHIEQILFHSSPIISFSQSDVAFQGLEETLSMFTATGARFPVQWNWNKFRNLHRLKLINVNKAKLKSIENQFPHLPNLKVLVFQNANIEFIVDFAFAKLPEMFRLWLPSNNILELKRNMFPNPAVHLREIDLSDNNLQSLPEDIFSNMPALTSISFDSNKFTTLYENPFRYAFEVFSDLSILGNPIRCDCRLQWIIGTRFPVRFHANCAFPTALKDIPLAKLNKKLLQC